MEFISNALLQTFKQFSDSLYSDESCEVNKLQRDPNHNFLERDK